MRCDTRGIWHSDTETDKGQHRQGQQQTSTHARVVWCEKLTELRAGGEVCVWMTTDQSRCCCTRLTRGGGGVVRGISDKARGAICKGGMCDEGHNEDTDTHTHTYIPCQTKPA